MKYDEKYLDMVRTRILELAAGTDAVIFLFGSRARGSFRQGSDIDVGIENISREEFLKLKSRFGLYWEESTVPLKVDLVYFPDMDEKFAAEARKDIIQWKIV